MYYSLDGSGNYMRLVVFDVLVDKGYLQICVTNISFYQLVLLDTLQLAAGATGLFCQGATVVVHGCSICVLGPIVSQITCSAGGVAFGVHQCLP